MCVLGIDFGEKRVGLALSDPKARYAIPLTTLERRNDRSVAREICRLAAERGVVRLVLGEPLGLDGNRGEAAQRVRRFGNRLEKTSGLPLQYVDEALTSVEAEAQLREMGVDPRKNPGRVDSLAAQILLQEALARQAPVAEDPQ
ncbi:MAG: Holliday junction resolvase RuvX [Deltaproteobacteria bacterium]|nr:Holliday junction resolvase RuvX [Deltaproteobacteria bacterium]